MLLILTVATMLGRSPALATRGIRTTNLTRAARILTSVEQVVGSPTAARTLSASTMWAVTAVGARRAMLTGWLILVRLPTLKY